MKKLLLVALVLGGLTFVRPAPADAHVSFAFGLPGFGLFINAPVPAPVVYYDAPVYYPPPVYRSYYAPVYRRPCHFRGHGYYRHRRWY